MSKWAAILERDSLQAFPCIAELEPPGLMCCYGKSLDGDSCSDPACPARPIFAEYLLLRAVVEAELTVSIGATPETIAKGWRNYSGQRYITDWQRERANKRADAWDGLT